MILLPVFYHKWKPPCDRAAGSGKCGGIPSPPLSTVLAPVPAPRPPSHAWCHRWAPWKPEPLSSQGGGHPQDQTLKHTAAVGQEQPQGSGHAVPRPTVGSPCGTEPGSLPAQTTSSSGKG